MDLKMKRNNFHGLHLVEIEITNACNLNCKHCYVNREKIDFMQYDTAKSIIDQCAEMGVHRIVFTGGETLLHKSLIRLARYAKAQGIQEIVLFTNGLLIDEDNAQQLSVFNFVQISIDVLPGKKGHFRIEYANEVEKRVKLLKSKNITVALLATLHHSLLPFISDMVQYAKRLDIRIAFDKLIPIGDDEELKKECLTPSELKSALYELSSWIHKGYNVGCSDPLLFLVDKERMQYYKSIKREGIKGGCTAGIASLYIAVDGEAYSCPFVQVSAGNLKFQPLKELWYKSPILNQIRDRKSYKGKCGRCKFLDFCGGCRGASLYHTKSLTDSDPNCFLQF